MKTLSIISICAAICCGQPVFSQTTVYTNQLRQYQYPTQLESIVSVDPSGQQLSQLAIDPGGARFELWTIDSSKMTDFLLAERYVGTVPLGEITIRSEDRGGTSEDMTGTVARTRADRPFYVDVKVSEIKSEADAPAITKSLKFNHYIQSYGESGTDVGLDRSLATLHTQESITENGTKTYEHLITILPGEDMWKKQGEERFSLYSLADAANNLPESLVASQYIQIIPVADATISGIATGETIRFTVPTLTIVLNDLYPGSMTYVQVYKGDYQENAVGTVVAQWTNTESGPVDKTLVIDDWDSALTENGRWTIEVRTSTPFGVEYMRSPDGEQTRIPFDVDRTIKANGSFTTIE